jgi:transposase-like protein
MRIPARSARFDAANQSRGRPSLLCFVRRSSRAPILRVVATLHPTSRRSAVKADANRRRFITLVEQRGGGPPRPMQADDPGEHSLRATLSISDVAWELGVCAETVYRRAKAGELPGAFKIGRTWRVARAVPASTFESLGRQTRRASASLRQVRLKQEPRGCPLNC